MRSVTEFANFALNQGLKTKTALAAEGKSPEEIEQSLGAAFKLEGDKLKYFLNAMEVASQNAENLKRILVLSFNEGENAPSKAVKVDELHYLPEFHIDPKKAQAPKDDGKGGRGKGRGGRGGPGRGGDRGKKESPWGLSPEEKAAKAAKSAGPKPVKPS